MVTQEREWDGVIWLDRGRHRGGVGRLCGFFRSAWEAQRTRRQLAAMDDRMLADIGIGRADAYEEARRAPWDVAPRPR